MKARRIFHKDNNSQLSINIPARTTSKTYKNVLFDERKEVRESVKEEAKEISRQDRLFPILSFLDFISRFSLSRHPLAPVFVFQPFFTSIMKQKSLLFYIFKVFTKRSFWRKIIPDKGEEKPEAAD